MDVLSNEILVRIVRLSQPRAWISLQRTNRRLRALVLKWELTVVSLDVFSEYCLGQYKETIDTELFIHFIAHQFLNLKRLVLSGCPLYLSWSDLVTLGQYLPELERLDLSQHHHQPKLAFNSLLALPSLRNLKSIALDGTLDRMATHNHYHLQVPSLHLMPKLTEISLDKSDILFRMLQTMKLKKNYFTELIRFRVGVKPGTILGWSDFEALVWFLETHQGLVSLELHDLTLVYTKSTWKILQQILRMSKLRYLVMSHCECSDDDFNRGQIPNELSICASDLRLLRLLNSNLCTNVLIEELSKRCPSMAICSDV